MRPALQCHAAMLATSLGLVLVAPAVIATSPPAGSTGSATPSHPSAIASAVAWLADQGVQVDRIQES